MSTNFYWAPNLYLPVDLLSENIKEFAREVLKNNNHINNNLFDEDHVMVHILKRAQALDFCRCNYCNIMIERKIIVQKGFIQQKEFEGLENMKCPECGNIVYPALKCTWTLMKHLELIKELTKPETNVALKLIDDRVIVDEYGNLYNLEKFLNYEIDDCIYTEYTCRFS